MKIQNHRIDIMVNSFYFGYEENRKKERLTFRLKGSLLNKINKHPKPASEVIRSALEKYFSNS